MANMTLPDTQSLSDKMNKTKAKLDRMLAFWKIEVGGLASRSLEIINDPILLKRACFAIQLCLTRRLILSGKSLRREYEAIPGYQLLRLAIKTEFCISFPQYQCFESTFKS
jgi:hypothetical protein